MADFIKKNLVLVIVLAVTFIAAVVLIVLTLSTHFKVQESIQNINDNNELVKNRIDKTYPNPVDESAELILKDAAEIHEKAGDLQKTFGKLYNKMFVDFVKKMNEMQLTGPEVDAENAAFAAENEGKKGSRKKADQISVANPQLHFTPEELTDEFQSIYKKYQAEAKKNAPKESRGRRTESSAAAEDLLEEAASREIFAEFRKAVISAPKAIAKDEEKAQTYEKNAAVKFDTAFAEFRQAVRPLTLEPMTDAAAEAILMQAMGLPRTMVPRDCLVYMTKMFDNMASNNTIPGANAYSAKDKVKAFTYDPMGQPPPPEDIKSIFRRFQMMEDLFMRLNRAGIISLTDVDYTESGLNGETLSGGQYLKYKFTITVEAKLDQVRNLLNELQTAFEDNRVYIVSEMEFTRVDSGEVKGVDFGGSSAAGRRGSVRGGPNLPGGSNDPDAIMRGGRTSTPGMPKLPGMTRNYQNNSGYPGMPEEEIDYSLDPNYGQAEVGLSEVVSVRITIEYLIFIGDEIKGKKR